MSLIARETGGADFEIHPEGMVACRCTQIIDLGTQEGTFMGAKKLTHKVQIRWESSKKMTEGEFAGRPLIISKRYTFSLTENANLLKDLESWRGKRLSEAERKGGFDLKAVLGKACLINVMHSTANGKTYANIASINPLPPEMSAPKASGELLLFSLEDFDEEVFEKLGKGTKATIQKSPEYQRAIGKAYAKGEQEAGKASSLEDMEDDVPF